MNVRVALKTILPRRSVPILTYTNKDSEVRITSQKYVSSDSAELTLDLSRAYVSYKGKKIPFADGEHLEITVKPGGDFDVWGEADLDLGMVHMLDYSPSGQRADIEFDGHTAKVVVCRIHIQYDAPPEPTEYEPYNVSVTEVIQSSVYRGEGSSVLTWEVVQKNIIAPMRAFAEKFIARCTEKKNQIDILYGNGVHAYLRRLRTIREADYDVYGTGQLHKLSDFDSLPLRETDYIEY